jgi:hypothetical protein
MQERTDMAKATSPILEIQDAITGLRDAVATYDDCPHFQFGAVKSCIAFALAAMPKSQRGAFLADMKRAEARYRSDAAKRTAAPSSRAHEAA